MGASSSHQGVKEPVSQVSMISYKINTEQKNAKSEERNGHTSRNEHKNGLSNGHHDQNGTHTNGTVQNYVKEGRREKQEDEIDAKERKFRKQAEFGIACFRPRRLQCLAKSLWTFIAFYSFCSMWLVTVMGYLRTQIMTLERYLHINSSQWGVLTTWNDVGSLIFVIVGSHFGKFAHVPRLLAASSLIVGVLMMSLSLIQAISPVYLPKAGNSSISLFSMWGNYLCDNSTISNNLEMHNMTSSLNGMALPMVEQGIHWGYYMMSAIMFVVGSVMSYDIPLVTYFVERNVQDSARSGVFVGALLAAFVLGSPISMFLGGAMSDIPVDLEDTQMTIYDPRWMGAWWLGFLIVGGGAALFSLPVCLIPRHILHDEEDEDDNDKNEEQEKGKGTGKLKSLFYGRSQQTTETKEKVSRQTEHKEVSQANWMDQLKDLPRSMKNVLTNVVVLLILLEAFVTMLGMNAKMTYGLKFMQEYFDMPASTLSYYLGLTQLASAVVGTFLGGYLTMRLRLTTAGMFKLCCVLQFFAFLGSFCFLFMTCPDHDIVGFSSNVTEGLCTCMEDDVLFVCGSDGINYISPCMAGCRQMAGLSYRECQVTGEHGTASPGFCDTNCSMFVPFLVVSVILMLGLTLTFTPRVLIIGRLVDSKDQPMAIGLSQFISKISAIVGPILFGELYDSACLIWPSSGGSCLLSDKEGLRWRLLGSMVVTQFCGTCLLFISTIIVHVKQRRGQNFNKDIEINIEAEDGDTDKNAATEQPQVAVL